MMSFLRYSAVSSVQRFRSLWNYYSDGLPPFVCPVWRTPHNWAGRIRGYSSNPGNGTDWSKSLDYMNTDVGGRDWLSNGYRCAFCILPTSMKVSSVSLADLPLLVQLIKLSQYGLNIAVLIDHSQQEATADHRVLTDHIQALCSQYYSMGTIGPPPSIHVDCSWGLLNESVLDLMGTLKNFRLDHTYKRVGESLEVYTRRLIVCRVWKELTKKHGPTLQVVWDHGGDEVNLQRVQLQSPSTSSRSQSWLPYSGVLVPDPWKVEESWKTRGKGREKMKVTRKLSSAAFSLSTFKAESSIYDIYQYCVRVKDSLCCSHLQSLTLLDQEEIEAVLEEHAARPDQRFAQHSLARSLLSMLHGGSAYSKARTCQTILAQLPETFSQAASPIDPTNGEDAVELLCSVLHSVTFPFTSPITFQQALLPFGHLKGENPLFVKGCREAVKQSDYVTPDHILSSGLTILGKKKVSPSVVIRWTSEN